MSNSEVFTNDSFVQAGGHDNVSPELMSETVGQRMWDLLGQFREDIGSFQTFREPDGGHTVCSDVAALGNEFKSKFGEAVLNVGAGSLVSLETVCKRGRSNGLERSVKRIHKLNGGFEKVSEWLKKIGRHD